MAVYVMALKGKGTELNEKIWRCEAEGLTEAKHYFVRLKGLNEQEFNKIFVVTELYNKDTQLHERIYERNKDTGTIRSRKPGDYGNERDE